MPPPDTLALTCADESTFGENRLEIAGGTRDY